MHRRSDIASAYREKLAEAKARSDVAPDYLESMRDAYQVLASPTRRADYDESIAPVVRQRPGRAAADDGEMVDWRARAIKFGIPLAILVIAIWAWKGRSRPAPPRAEVVSVTRIDASPASPARTEEARASASVPTVAPSMAPLSAEQLFARVSPAVVRVVAEPAQGSGVVVGSGSVITNCHVAQGGGSVQVKAGTEVLSASISVADEPLDLCMLSVPGLDAPAVTVGSVNNVRPGQRVYAIGSPLGLELTISEGIVSALREVEAGKVIQTTAAVSPGSSGGGLFAADGQLVGIVTFQSRTGQNLNFAIPADWIAEMRNRATRVSRATASPVASTSEDESPAQLVVGSWHCFGTLSGRNGTYIYSADGKMHIASNDGRNVSGEYRVAGKTIRYSVGGQGFAVDIESISQGRMVQFVESGQRLACERN